MKKIEIRNIILAKNPGFLSSFPQFVRNLAFSLIEKFLKLNEINMFLEKNRNLRGIDFIDEFFEYLDFSYIISKKERDRIPSEGGLIIISNHPLGGLDGLALLKLVSEVRKDVRIVVNDVLTHITNLSDHFLPVNVFNSEIQRENYLKIGMALKNEEAVIIFPAGEVSRLTPGGVKDGKWNKGILTFAKKFNADILPVHVSARNSVLFYLFSMIHKRASVFLLPAQLFNKRHRNILIRIGEPICQSTIFNSIDTAKMQLKLLKKHLYRIGRNKNGVYKTEKSIIQPPDHKEVVKQLSTSLLLGSMHDGKELRLVKGDNSTAVIKEIARLREITFRKIGEGTGRKLDNDISDNYYSHLVLWDPAGQDIIGAYRMGDCRKIIENHGISNLYTGTLFNFSDDFIPLLNETAELGRSFIRSRYWNTNALDYLWQGLGAWLSLNPHIRYLVGGVSLSGAYPPEAAALIIYYFKKWYSADEELAVSKNRYLLSSELNREISSILNSADAASDWQILKSKLQQFNLSVPPLFRQYTNLCEPDGVRFLDFGIDPDFGNCIDGFILIDLTRIKPEKRARYFKTLRKSGAA
ncbi:MAG: lysophospholipid acyltransferase family protein [Ignavibacteriaceae bacterium]|nr:lysophospholipid acyltransferase family protein [Ignavibacteriaceae bacterium]